MNNEIQELEEIHEMNNEIQELEQTQEEYDLGTGANL